MIDRRSRESYRTVEDKASVIGRTRSAYDELLRALGKLGTEVKRDRLLETNTNDCSSYVRRGIVEFIFPRQETVELTVEGGSVAGTLLQIVMERAMGAYDSTLITGHVLVEYVDSGGGADLEVVDLLGGDSVLPDEAIAAINTAFSVYEHINARP